MVRTLRDLQKLTGRSRATVIKEIEAGNMPGYRIGGTNNYHITDESFDLYAQGYWVPRSQRPPIYEVATQPLRRFDWLEPAVSIDVEDPDGALAAADRATMKARTKAKRQLGGKWDAKVLGETKAHLSYGRSGRELKVLDFGNSISILSIDQQKEDAAAAENRKRPARDRIVFEDSDECMAIRRLFSWAYGWGFQEPEP